VFAPPPLIIMLIILVVLLVIVVVIVVVVPVVVIVHQGKRLRLPVMAVGVVCIWGLTRWNLGKLEKVEPLSWDAVGLVWAYAFGFTAIIVLLLVATAVVLALASFVFRRH
jgi:hypothetical protein